MGGGEVSIARGGGASGVIASTTAGAGQGARIWGAMGATGGRDGGKITGSTAAGAGGGGTATGSKAGAATALAAAGGDEDGSTMSIIVGAATCSVGG